MPRKLGSKNKKTIEREERERLMRESSARLAALEEAGRRGADAVIEAAMVPRKKLGKDILDDLANLYMGMAALYQPWPEARGKNPNEDEARFRYYSERASATAAQLAPFQSPRLSAFAIGAAVVNKVTVEGGMPDDFVAPTSVGGEIAPGTIISADPIDDAVAVATGVAAA